MSEELFLIKQSQIKKSSKMFSWIIIRSLQGSTFTSLKPFLRLGQTLYEIRLGVALMSKAIKDRLD